MPLFRAEMLLCLKCGRVLKSCTKIVQESRENGNKITNNAIRFVN